MQNSFQIKLSWFYIWLMLRFVDICGDSNFSKLFPIDNVFIVIFEGLKPD